MGSADLILGLMISVVSLTGSGLTWGPGASVPSPLMWEDSSYPWAGPFPLTDYAKWKSKPSVVSIPLFLAPHAMCPDGLSTCHLSFLTMID